MKRDDEELLVDQEERDFVEHVAVHYAPPPSSSANRVAFDNALWARIEQPQRRGFMFPAALATAAVVALVWVTVFSSTPGPEQPASLVASVWEEELFLSDDVSRFDGGPDNQGLPDDYLAIAIFVDA